MFRIGVIGATGYIGTPSFLNIILDTDHLVSDVSWCVLWGLAKAQ